MKYYSTNNKKLACSLEEAVKRGLSADKGLFMPEHFPILSRDDLGKIKQSKSLAEIGIILADKLFGEDIPSDVLKELTSEALNFDTPLVEVDKNIYSLELFHGPTLAFKDVGARFMARMLQYFNKNNSEEVHVLVATSGDTGSAVANGFLDVEGIKVHVLYPSGQVSSLQEKQFTTLGKNITALEVNGSFDDCQALVKTAFSDSDLQNKLVLTSANSINLARFIPQSFYYFRAWSQMEEDNFIFSIPSGNYGNLTAGLLAREMGLPVHTFLAASNKNDVVPEYLRTGTYSARKSISTIANAMDVGDPSNFARILDIFAHQHDRVSRHIKGYSYSDEEIRQIMKEVYKNQGYILDPHGAIGYKAAKTYTEKFPETSAIFLETAHPAKFPEVVNEVIGKEVETPERLLAFAERKKKSIELEADFSSFKKYLMSL